MQTRSKWAYALSVSIGVFAALIVSLGMSGARSVFGLRALLVSATGRVFVPVLLSTAVIGLVTLVLRKRELFARSTKRVVPLIVWLPPLFLLSWQGSAFAVIPACLLGASAVSRFRAPRLRGFPMSFVTAALLQFGTVLWLVDRETKAALVLGLASIILSLMARMQRPRRQTWTRTAAAVAAALLFTIAALFPLMIGGGGSDAAGGANAGVPPKSKQEPGSKSDPSRGSMEVESEIHRGIILFPEEERVVKLVAPLPAMGRGLKKMSKTDPLSIPFYGVYWMFRAPFKEPPPGSYVLRGDPDVKSFRSGDFAPLTMEAYQNFGKLIDVNCCKQILLALRTADRFPSSILVELLLVNTTLAGKPRVSLGRIELTSTPPIRSAALETLSFDVPAATPIEQFDQISVIFHRSKLRSYRSAKTAIERFVLIPRR